MKRIIVCLCVAALVGVFFSMGAQAEDAKYIGNKMCKMCHDKPEMGKIWTSWQDTKHAKALAPLSTDEAKAMATKAGVTKPAAEAPECLKCHVTAFDAASNGPAAPLVKEDGVQCEACHGPASLHKADAMKYASDKTVKMDAHIKAKPDETVCKQCHNEKSPTWKGSFDFKAQYEKIKHTDPNLHK